MAETVLSNLRTRGTLAVVGVATLASVVITTATITTLGVTTANIATANVQTLSGATIGAMQANGIVKARTVSGAVLKFGGGTALGILCKKADGTVGTVTRTSTGTIAVGACS